MNYAETSVVKASQESIARTNPDWDYKFWDDEAVSRLIRDKMPYKYKFWNTLPNKKIQKWDIARYLLVGKLGGMYADIDTIFHKNLNEILDLDKRLIFRGPVSLNTKKPFIKNHFFLSKTDDPFWGYVYSRIAKFKKDRAFHFRRNAHRATGCISLALSFCDYVDGNRLSLSDVQVLDRNYVVNDGLRYEPSIKNFDVDKVFITHYVKATWKMNYTKKLENLK